MGQRQMRAGLGTGGQRLFQQAGPLPEPPSPFFRLARGVSESKLYACFRVIGTTFPKATAWNRWTENGALRSGRDFPHRISDVKRRTMGATCSIDPVENGGCGGRLSGSVEPLGLGTTALAERSRWNCPLGALQSFSPLMPRPCRAHRFSTGWPIIGTTARLAGSFRLTANATHPASRP